ncbi:MAG: flagellar motor switch protein FliM [Dehalococcoidia bacterium]
MADSAVLSQREIDALMNGEAQDGGDDGPAAAVASRNDGAGHRIKTYDFRHPEKLSKEQLRGLQMIQQGVSGALATAFSNRLRAPVDSRLSALERGIYEEYVTQIGQNSVVIVIDMNPLSGFAVASFALDVAFGIVDRLLGGKGKQFNYGPERELTDIETALVRHIGMDIASALIEPWGRVVPGLQPDVTEIAVGPQLVQAIPGSQFVLTAWYEVRFGEQTGGISLCFPLTVLEQILPKLTGQTLFETRSSKMPGALEKVRDEHLMPMTVELRAVLGNAVVPAVDLAMLAPGDVIVLDKPVGDPTHIMIGNCERFAGSPGTRGRKLALQISGTVDDDGFVKPYGGGH